MMSVAFDYSEAIKEPVLLRVVTRLAHSRAGVVVKEPREENGINISTDAWVLLPGIARKKYDALIGKQEEMLMASNKSEFNKSEYTDYENKEEKTGIVACGIGMSYAGKRALVCMKHVGMNVCADAFINSAITGVQGGLVVLAADDPSMH